MKIMIAYPPLKSDKGVPLLGQNRQFQWFNNPTYIYPMVPAYAASLLKEKGYDVIWADGIAEEMSEEEYIELIKKENPDLIMIESKTPVIKRHWKFVDYLKKEFPKMVTILVGDHVTAMPKETMENCKVDYVLTGGDYDFLLLNIANHISKNEKLEPGIWHRETKNEKLKTENYGSTGNFELKHDLNTLPMVDRDLTKWELYAYKNGNYKYTPGTYTMIGRDCWWGKCTFCSWTTIFPQFRTSKPERLLDEIEILVNKYHVKEIMDDTGCFPAGGWLETFCKGMIDRGLNKKVVLDCNMRVNALNKKQYELMKKAGFRFILFGLESANQSTLDRINKNIKVEDIEVAAKLSKEAGLEPHMTCMVGYPWETLEDAQRTIDLTKQLFDKGYIDTLQATVIMPYPGTPLFKYCQKEGLLKHEDWERYDMREPIMKSPIGDEKLKELTQGIYKSFISPKFIFRKIFSIRNFDDVKFLWRAGMKLIGHLLDFSSKK
jgi:radical SAM superfamily enzyme YgiQ (UPF0313 family)